MTEPEEKKGPPFERLVAAVQRKLDPGSRVEWDARVSGRNAEGRHRQIDVAVWGSMGSAKIFIAIEAKNYGKKVGIEKVEAFATKLGDIGANKGIMVAPLGFTLGALAAAAA